MNMERVLAYVTSTQLTEDELLNVSGGGLQKGTRRPCGVKSTSGDEKGDIVVDMIPDWKFIN